MGVNTSPTKYPLPPLFIVAAIATPFSIVMLAEALIPVPVTEVKDTLLYCCPPTAGVNPNPGLVMVRGV